MNKVGRSIGRGPHFANWKHRCQFLKPSILRIIEELVVVFSLGSAWLDLGATRADEEYIKACFREGWQA